MLPPFVPPSARSASEHLPLITDFVVARTERSFAATPETGAAAVSAPAASAIPAPVDVERTSHGFVVDGIEYSATLPSIEEYVARERYIERPDAVQGGPGAVVEETSPFVQLRHNREEAARPTVEPEAEPQPVAAASVETAEIAHSEVADEPAAPVAPAVAAAEPATPVTLTTSESPEPVPQTRPSGPDWVEVERDSFDWQAVATLAAPADETERAAQEWMTTDWDTPSASPSEYVAAMLVRLARRVRSGELKIDAVRGMSTEAALAAVLTALLSDPDTRS